MNGSSCRGIYFAYLVRVILGSKQNSFSDVVELNLYFLQSNIFLFYGWNIRAVVARVEACRSTVTLFTFHRDAANISENILKF